MKRLILNLKMHFFNFVLTIEDFLNKLKGQKTEVTLEEAREIKQLENTRLKTAIKKLTHKMYEYDEEAGVYRLKNTVKQKDFDLVQLLEKEEMSLRDKIRIYRIQGRVLKKPLDTSGTEDAMVEHNVKNAPRYDLELQRRELAKEKMTALRNNNSAKAKELAKKIEHLNLKIKQMKENV